MKSAKISALYTSLRLLRSHHDRATTRKKRARRMRKAFQKQQAKERFLFAFIMSTAIATMHWAADRVVWVKERSSYWWERIVNVTFTPNDWIENFRMSNSTFTYLCNELRPSIQKRDTVMRKAISVEQRIAITLWRLATTTDYRTIGHLFGVSKTAVCLIVKEVCSAIVEVLLPRYIKVPTGDSLKEVIRGFKHKWGFPQCAGAVDGTHISIMSPRDFPADYFNRKGWHSIIMQGMVDHLYRFTDIYIGWPGRVHDARVFGNSTLYQKGVNGTLFPEWTKTIAQEEIPLVVLGDPAYPLLPWVMKPYIDNGHLSRDQRRFNYRLSRARVVVEDAYGRLKGRWRCLSKRNDTEISDLPELIAACCVLHNLCEIHGERFNEDWLQDLDTSNINQGCTMDSDSNGSHKNGEDIRKALTTYFKDN